MVESTRAHHEDLMFIYTTMCHLLLLLCSSLGLELDALLMEGEVGSSCCFVCGSHASIIVWLHHYCKVVTDNLKLEVNLVEGLIVVDANNASNHLMGRK
jgi:hypothetical protein